MQQDFLRRVHLDDGKALRVISEINKKSGQVTQTNHRNLGAIIILLQKRAYYKRSNTNNRIMHYSG